MKHIRAGEYPMGGVGTGAYFILFHVGTRVHIASFSSYFSLAVQIPGVCKTSSLCGTEGRECPPDTATTPLFPWVGVAQKLPTLQ